MQAQDIHHGDAVPVQKRMWREAVTAHREKALSVHAILPGHPLYFGVLRFNDFYQRWSLCSCLGLHFPSRLLLASRLHPAACCYKGGAIYSTLLLSHRNMGSV